MYRRSMFHLCGLAAASLIVLMSGAAAQAQQKSAKDLIAGTWTLLIADNLTSEGTRSPGFGPLPDGTVKFGADGKYSVEIKPSVSGHEALKYSGSYALDDAGKTLSLKIEESSLPNWRGTTQSGTIEFVNGDHLGWTTSVPFVASADLKGAETIWARAQ
jgi:Lipocalin-like domain